MPAHSSHVLKAKRPFYRCSLVLVDSEATAGPTGIVHMIGRKVLEDACDLRHDQIFSEAMVRELQDLK